MQTVQAIEKRKGAHNLALVCFLLLNLADSIITWWALAMGLMELNWYRFLLDAMPVWAVLWLKLGLAGLFAFLVQIQDGAFQAPECGAGAYCGV